MNILCRGLFYQIDFVLIKSLTNFHINQNAHNNERNHSKVLDLPGQIAGRVLGSRVSDTLDNFDSSNGIRSYFQTIYSWLALGMCILMVWGLIDGAGDYFGGADTMGMIASIRHDVDLLGRSLCHPKCGTHARRFLCRQPQRHDPFLAHDVVKTNIRLFG